MSANTIQINYVGLLKGHTNSVTCLAVGGTNEKPILYSGSRDKSIIQWDLHLNDKVEFEYEDQTKDYYLGKPFKSLRGHNHFVSCISLSSDGKRLVSGSWDKTARIWDLDKMKTTKILKGHSKDILCCTYSPDERMIFTGSMDKTLKYWNNLGEMKYEQNQIYGWVSSLVNIKKGKEHFMAVGSWDSDVRIFNGDYSNFRVIKGNDYAITSMSVSNEGEYLFVAHKNGTIKVYLLAEDESKEDVCKQTIETNVNINSILFDETYFNVYAIGTSNGFQIREIKGKCLFDYNTPTKAACNCITYDLSKGYLFAGFDDGIIRVFQISTQ